MLGNISLVWGVTIAYFIARAVLPDEDDSEKLWAFALSVRDARMPQWTYAHASQSPRRATLTPPPGTATAVASALATPATVASLHRTRHLGPPPRALTVPLAPFPQVVLLPLTFGDALGEVIGTPFGRHRFKVRGLGEINQKSLEGCVAVFLGSLVPLLIIAGARSLCSSPALSTSLLPLPLARLPPSPLVLAFAHTPWLLCVHSHLLP